VEFDIDDFPEFIPMPRNHAENLKVPAKRFSKGSHLMCGYTSDDERWLPFDEYRVSGSFDLCDNSRRIDSHLRRFYSMDYARLLKTYHPEIYERIHQVGNPKLYLLAKGVDPQSDRAKSVIAEYVKARMKRR